MPDPQELARDLDEFVTDDLDWPDDDEQPIEAPPDADVANAMLRRLRSFDREAREVQAVADAELVRIQAWRDDRLAGLGRQMDRLTSALDGYARAVNRLDPKRKTIGLPNGTLKLRAPRERCVVQDDLALGLWQREQMIDWLAEYLADGAPVEDERPQAETIVDTILSSEAVPFGRVKVEPDRKALGSLPKGAEIGENDAAETEWHVVAGEGEIVPGVEIVKPTADTFSVDVP